jgi:hypothetical protein
MTPANMTAFAELDAQNLGEWPVFAPSRHRLSGCNRTKVAGIVSTLDDTSSAEPMRTAICIG